jgi:hypothetical protein
MEEECLAGGGALIIQSGDTFSDDPDGTSQILVERISASIIRWKTE